MHVFVFLSAQTYGLLGFTNSYYTGFRSPFRLCLVLDLERNSNVWSALNVWLHLAKKALRYLLEALEEEYHIFFCRKSPQTLSESGICRTGSFQFCGWTLCNRTGFLGGGWGGDFSINSSHSDSRAGASWCADWAVLGQEGKCYTEATLPHRSSQTRQCQSQQTLPSYGVWELALESSWCGFAVSCTWARLCIAYREPFPCQHKPCAAPQWEQETVSPQACPGNYQCHTYTPVLHQSKPDRNHIPPA